jgi:Bacterial Ig-like domain
MRRLLLLTLLWSDFATCVLADPLKLTSTSPQFWATNVSPTTQKTISLTFDQRLRARLTDWIGLDVLSPPSDLQTTFSPDHMSCSVDVHLDPGHVYICALNGRGIPGVGFQSEKGLSLPATYLVFQTAGTVAQQDAPPHVLRTIPQHGATGVDGERVRTISITFDKPMNIKKHGLHVFENNNPIDVSRVQPVYSPDGLTFTVPYNFKPAMQYRLELNSINDIGFSGANRAPLWPVQVSFTTAQ